ncbi:MAG: hypothetical protein H6573_26175 [Lewinellaceae bacterium]|nr:hypothetical protein [Phaeodactylibacter sp.]MCB9350963.1 hypothetical protein [Lewinellaceae bacterium]
MFRPRLHATLRQPVVFLALLLAGYLLSCTAQEVKNEAPPLNPNGDSELALLMRAMFDDALLMKQQIEQGEPAQPGLDYQKILTAQATEPEKAASNTYKVHALSYLQTIKALQQADAAQAATLYENMVNSCMGCHKALCPGPTVRIRKLY